MDISNVYPVGAPVVVEFKGDVTGTIVRGKAFTNSRGVSKIWLEGYKHAIALKYVKLA